MKNNNQKVIRCLSMRSLKNNRMRNTFAIAAIALTCMLFTTLAAMGTGISDAMQESTMREVGGRFHAGLKAATAQQMKKAAADSRVKDYSWNIFLGVAENLNKRQYEIRLAQGKEELENSFIQLEEGTLPQKEDDIIADTYLLDELKLPHKLGGEIPLEFTFHGKKITKTFRVCGWYDGNSLGHASELYVSETFWNQLKGELTDRDFKEWGKANPQDAGVGLYSVGLYFDSAKNSEETVRSVIRDAGYYPNGEAEGHSWEESLDYGVNWAYMQNRAENSDPLTIVVLGSALVIILLAGYLIIYNIFYISVFQDIRFYGLLKTVGTTRKQIRSMIRRQALILSAAGIPLGLAAGYAVSDLIFPFVMEMTAFSQLDIKMKFHPSVAVFGVLFALITVFISCRKPGKIAGSVSPVEAIRFTEGSRSRKKSKKSETGAQIHRMALSNLSRSRKKTALVLISLSMSVVLLCVVLTGVGSFRVDAYLEQRLLGDVLLASTNIIGNGAVRVVDYELDKEYVELADSQPGVTAKNELWQTYGQTDLFMDDKALNRYQKYQDEGKLRQDGWGMEIIHNARERRQLETRIYAYDEAVLSKLKVLKGELDLQKFAQGGYVLLTDIIGDHTAGASVYEPGEKLKVLEVSEDSDFIETKDENGNSTGGYWENLKETEYEVMAIVEIPSSMTDLTSPVNGVQAVLPKQDVQNSLYSWCFGISYEVEEEYLEQFTQAVKDYSENVNKNMGYLAKDSLEEGFQTMIGSIRMIGIALSAVIALIGVLNFINSVVTGILARKHEFAVLCSIGMTEQQLKRMLLEESLYYVLISGGISLILGIALSRVLLLALNNVIMFFSYRPNFLAFAIMFPLFFILAVLVPHLAYNRMKKESIVERLRNTEE